MSLPLRLSFCAAWAALVALGFGYVWRYESSAGVPARPSRFSETRHLSLDLGVPTVMVFAHPNCPCTMASLEGLAELFREKPGRARLYVEIVQAPGLSTDLATSQTATMARKIEGAVVVADPSGAEAKRFGAATSGQVVVFDPSGTQLFCGGVTNSRGHIGPNAGLDAVAAILDGKKPVGDSTPVFGCSLLGGIK